MALPFPSSAVGRIEGDILYGGERPRGRFLRRHTGYVEQQDTLLPTLTVREMLAYQAFMKRPHSERRGRCGVFCHC